MSASPSGARPSGSDGPAIEVSDLHVVRGGVRAVDGVSFSVPYGQVAGLLGPSGCGKTSLMRSVVGVQIVESGDVTVAGLPAGHPDLRSRIGYVTQAPSVYDDLTVEENLNFFGRVLGLDGAEVDRCIDAVELDDHRDRVASRLSGGQRSRVSLAVALLGSPELLVLDEPTVGLDPVLRRDLWQLFHRLADQGSAVLVSSHVLSEVQQTVDEVVVLSRGRLVRQGTLADLDSGPREVLVRTPTPDLLTEALAAGPMSVVGADASGRLRVVGGTPEQVGRAAHEAHVELHELVAEASHLERVFLELTQGGHA